MLDALLLATVLYTSPTPEPTPPPRDIAPSRGYAGRFMDSNVPAVWNGATFTERLTWLCIRKHESWNSGYDAVNPNTSVTTASGAGQWLDSTWRGLVVWLRFDGRWVDRTATKYPRANAAPAFIQDLAFRHVYKRDRITGRGMEMWRGTGCPGT